MTLTWASGRQHSSHHRLSSSIFLRRELPVTVTLLSIFAEAVLKHGTNYLNLVNFADRSSITSSLCSSSGFRASNLLHRGIWANKVGRNGVCLSDWAGTCFHSFFCLKLPHAWWWQSRGSTTLWGLSPLCLSCRFGKESLHQSVSYSHSLMLLNLFTSSLSSASILNRLSIHSHLMQVVSHATHLPSEATASDTPCRQRPEQPFLGKHSIWLTTFFLASAVCLVETMAKFVACNITEMLRRW